MNRFILSATLCTMAAILTGCEGDSSTTETTSNTTINEASTNAVSEIVVTQDGSGNYVQIDMETGAYTPIDISQIGSNNIVVIDISAPVIPPLPTPPTPEL
jgi:hypothetical protein